MEGKANPPAAGALIAGHRLGSRVDAANKTRRGMKKGILALGAVGLLLSVPVVASGASSAAMRGGDNYEIRFVLKAFDGEPTELRRFRFKKLNATCEGGSVIEVRGRIPSIPVNDRNKFRAVLRRGGKVVRVKGRVSGDLDTVRGRIRARGDFGPEAQNCDSGVVRWKAEQ